MRKICAALLALALLALPALAEGQAFQGDGFELILPEGMTVLPEETVEGYVEGAVQDIRGELGDPGEEPAGFGAVLVATAEEGGSLNLVMGSAEGRTALELAQAAREELTELVAGLSANEGLGGGEANGLEYSFFNCSLYGSSLRQYFLVAGDTAYCITFTDLPEETMEAVIASFTLKE